MFQSQAGPPELDGLAIPINLTGQESETMWMVRVRQIVVDFYDKLDAETRSLVPLRRLYWPAVKVSL
jgi:hypothetical protein